MRLTSVVLFVAVISNFLLANCSCTPYIQPIHEAVQRNDLSTLMKLIKKGADINTLDGRGRTPLYWASLMGHIDIVKYLISMGADINKGASWKDNRAPIHVAAMQGHCDIVALLIHNGVNPDSKSWSDETPLQLAAKNGRKDIIILLLQNGIKVNAKDHYGNTALSFAQQGNHTDIIQILKEYGAK